MKNGELYRSLKGLCRASGIAAVLECFEAAGGDRRP